MIDDQSSAGVLHATVSEGVVWFTRNAETPRSFSRPPVDFPTSAYCRGARELRIVALAPNAELIAAAYPAAQERGFKVLLASPLLVSTRATRRNPRSVLGRSLELTNSGCAPPASVGGWHLMTPDERLVYAAAARLVAGADPEEAAALLADHPLQRRLSFVAPCDEAAVARIVALVRDPRWYVNPASPDSVRKLYNFMGFDVRADEAEAFARREMAAAVWRLPDRVEPGVSKTPRGFLWRHYYKLLADGESIGEAELKTSRLFLRYLRNVWLGVTAEAEGVRGDGLFVPEYFFDWALESNGKKDPFAAEVARAYVEYAAEPTAARGT